VLRRGDHAGTVIEVEGQSFGGNIRYHVVKKSDNTGSSSEDDFGRTHSKKRAEFLTLYARNYKSKRGQTQSAFRQNNALRKAQLAVLEPAQEVAELVAPTMTERNGTGIGADLAAKYGISLGIETITPAMAQAWLDRGGVNRKPSERAIQKLMWAIQLGEWDMTGETIKLDKDGKVRDGQHRLHAIIRAGIAVDNIVVRGISESAFDKIDTGKSRSMADVISIHGHAQSIAKATAARGLMLIEQTGRLSSGRSRVGSIPLPSNAAGLAYIEAHPEVDEGIRLANKVRILGGFVGGTGLWAMPLAMFWRISPEQTEVFVDHLVEGANLEKGSPILRLRNSYQGKGRDWHAVGESRERLVAITIKAWNHWRRDEVVQQISWHSTGRGAEKFPMPE